MFAFLEITGSFLLKYVHDAMNSGKMDLLNDGLSFEKCKN